MADSFAGGQGLARGSKVVVVVSQGPGPSPAASNLQVPSLVGRPQGDALAALQEVGLRVRVFNSSNASVPKGRVTAQVPRENAVAPAGSEVVLLVSTGPVDAGQGLVALPDTMGMAQADAVTALQAAGFNVEVAEVPSLTVPAGIVLDQLPSSSDLAAPPARKKTSPWLWVAMVAAVLVVAIGAAFYARSAPSPEAETVAVPDVVGLSQAAATTELQEAGLRANPRTNEDASVAPDTVTAQSPAPGSQVAIDTRVDIIVAVAPETDTPSQVKVPDVVGMSRSDAEATLKNAGLNAAAVENPSDTVAKGSVIAQLPTAGALVVPGADVAIAVSSGPPESAKTVTVPDLVGMTTADAETAVRDAGLEVQSIAVAGTPETPGLVFDQSPDSGSSVPEGSVVTVLFAE